MLFVPVPRLRGLIIGVLCAALCALLPACSMLRLGYGQAPDLAYWWLDAYADFNDLQTPRVRNALALWFVWNRRSQLPDYAALLVRAQTEAPADTTPERACAFEDDLRARLDLAVDRAVPAAAEIALTLTPAQIQHIERRYAKSNDEFRADYLQSDRAQRAKASAKRAVDRIEMVYGELDDAQLELIAKAVTVSPFNPELWFAERRRRQQDVLQMLRKLTTERPSPERAQAAVRAHIKQYERSPNEAYRAYAARLTDFNCGLAAVLHNGMSAAQRQTAVQRLKGWENDVRVLAGEAVP
jgi:Family of unknown function (DUF6279)